MSSQVPNHFPADFEYCNIRIDDSETEDITPHFRTAVKFMSRAVKARRCVFVHCVAGVSRSVTVVAAYLMAKNRMPLQAVLELVRCRLHCSELHSLGTGTVS